MMTFSFLLHLHSKTEIAAEYKKNVFLITETDIFLQYPKMISQTQYWGKNRATVKM